MHLKLLQRFPITSNNKIRKYVALKKIRGIFQFCHLNSIKYNHYFDVLCGMHMFLYQKHLYISRKRNHIKQPCFKKNIQEASQLEDQVSVITQELIEVSGSERLRILIRLVIWFLLNHFCSIRQRHSMEENISLLKVATS